MVVDRRRSSTVVWLRLTDCLSLVWLTDCLSWIGSIVVVIVAVGAVVAVVITAHPDTYPYSRAVVMVGPNP